MKLTFTDTYRSIRDVEAFFCNNDKFILCGDKDFLITYYNRFTKQSKKKIEEMIVFNKQNIDKIISKMNRHKTIICSWHLNSILKILAKNSSLEYCTDYISYYHMDLLFLDIIKDGCGIEFVHYFQKNNNKFQKIYNILNDKYSKNKFKKVLQYRADIYNPERINFDKIPFKIKEAKEVERRAKDYQEAVKQIPKNLQFANAFSISANRYQYKNKKNNLQDKKCILDIGAYNNTALMFSFYAPNAKIYAFEPQKNIHKDNIEISNTYTNIIPINKGVGETNTTLFIEDNILGADTKVYHTQKEGLEPIEVVSIDSFCQKNDIIPDLIKMDIEGSEAEALRGGAATIQKYKPDLAISIYHYVADLHDIIFLIKKILPQYKIYIDHRYFAIGETICFATHKL